MIGETKPGGRPLAFFVVVVVVVVITRAKCICAIEHVSPYV